MKRWAAGLEYVGSAHAGWQILREQKTLQAEFERALSNVAAHPVAITAAGRTDAGVHALNQVIHFDSGAERSAYAWTLGTNTNLPPELSVRWVREVRDDFHARFSARARRYRYVLHNARARSALCAQRAGWWTYPLDERAMHEAGQALIGEHDFSAFRDSQCQSRTPMRKLFELRVSRRGEFVVLDLRGNAFLHHMVRNIVGVLAEIGQGRRAVSWAGEVLASRDRTRAGVTMPSCGLYFVGPEYPAEFALPAPPEPWFP